MKTFSLNEAQSLLPILETLLRRAIEAKNSAEEGEEELQQLGQRVFFSGGMRLDPVEIGRKRSALNTSVQQVKDAVQEIDSIGVQVKDLDSGLLDFPCRLGDDIVLLCWKLGETRITHWHSVDSGFQGRQPVDERFLKNSPDKPN
ncbi:MAG TPA: DUF2203 domain-containing protein [Acidobacteriaceae bacterium]|jgi:hypothetical protein